MKHLSLLPLASALFFLLACSNDEPAQAPTVPSDGGAAGSASLEDDKEQPPALPELSGMRGLTGLEIAAEMAPGLNLWNTLDANGHWVTGLDSETCWGNPVTTKEMITAMKGRGFQTLRVPVTWYNHMGPAPEFAIDEEWMDRVEEVVNYALDNDMYAIVNIHHDDYDEDVNKAGTWLSPTYAKQEAVTDQLEKVWTQVATRFQDYDDYLIFETMNEPREIGTDHEWSGGNAENRDVVNALNLAAVNAIRATGGNNTERFIMVPPVGANGGALADLVIPNDDPNIMVSVHNYNPFFFTLAGEDIGGVDTWGTDEEVASLRSEIKSYHDNYIAKGRAIILGEWGAGDKDNDDARVKYYQEFAGACAENQVTSIAWIYEFDRSSLTWTFPLLEDQILEAYSAN